MTKSILITAILILQTQAYTQVVWEEGQRLVYDSQFYPSNVITADIDGDGDKDIVCGNHGYLSLEWYENLDGQGNFGSAQFVADGFDGLKDILAADIDSDGDMDLISSSRFSDEVAWFENMDGLGDFGPRQVIFNETNFNPQGIDAADLDGDSDLDILISADFYFGGTWHENLDGQGNFGPNMSVIHNNDGTRRAKAGDLDGDGDNDFILCESSGYIRWAENLDGQGNFGPPILITDQIDTPTWLSIVDIDNDNDLDIITTEIVDGLEGYIVLLRNLDGQGNFGAPEFLIDVEQTPYNVHPVDFDKDGDLDMFFSGSRGSISWFENLGNETFGPNQPITILTGPLSMSPDDIDGDGDIDVVVLSYFYGIMAWIKNASPLIVSESTFDTISVFPNPVKDVLYLQNSATNELLSMTVYNNLGQEVTSSKEAQINMQQLPSGVYFVKVKYTEGIQVKKVIKE